jgi:hypothetical protein
MDKDDQDSAQGTHTSSTSTAQPQTTHALNNVEDLLRTPTEGQDLRKSFFLPMEPYDGED